MHDPEIGTPVSIVICTRNRAQLLRACLGALAAEEDRGGADEILVVDNASSDETPRIVSKMSESLIGLRYVMESTQGLSHARNRGWREARGDWVAYLDDDAKVLPGYMSRLRSLIHEEFACVGGIYLPWYAEGRVPWFRDDYASNRREASTFGELPRERYVSGGNCLFRKSALAMVGGFPHTLGMSGNRVAYGEETRVQVELRRRGYRIGFDPTWRVEHLVPNHKQRVTWFLRQSFARGRDAWDAFDREPDARQLGRKLRQLLTGPIQGLWDELGQPREPRHWQNLVIAVFSPAFMAVGGLWGGVAKRSKRRG